MVDGVSVELVPQLCFLPILILVELMYLCWVWSSCCCQDVLILVHQLRILSIPIFSIVKVSFVDVVPYHDVEIS